MKLKNAAIKHGMALVLGLLALVARYPRWQGFNDRLLRGLARRVVRARAIAPATTLDGLGREWQKSFPARKQVPIVAISTDTVFAEIHTPCPLRGSGDLAACHRLMEFDRAVLRAAGGQFVVLESQAEPGRAICRVAMRPAGLALDDLRPAYAAP